MARSMDSSSHVERPASPSSFILDKTVTTLYPPVPLTRARRVAQDARISLARALEEGGLLVASRKLWRCGTTTRAGRVRAIPMPIF